MPNVTVLRSTTALRPVRPGLAVLAERRPMPRGFAPERLWKLRVAQTILATGAIERPLVFPDNDRPGVMSAFAARAYLRPARRARRAGAGGADQQRVPGGARPRRWPRPGPSR